MINLYGNERELKREHIEEFTKFRNDVTHGSYRVLTISIAETAYVMSGLVYCCMLKRIGFDMEQIIEFCRMKLLR